MDKRNISTLRNWDKNPRSIKKDAFERLKKQITKLGQYKPLLITPDGTVLGGNMRLRAYKDLGITDVWVSIVEPKTESEMMEYSLSDNDRAGFYDEDLLANIMPELDLDMSLYAVDLKDPTLLSDLMPTEEVEEDEAPALDDGEPESKLGEIYQLGRHRLMCGDSTDAGSITLLMNGEKAEIAFTSPPYNAGTTPTENKMGLDSKYANDNDNREDPEYLYLLTTSTLNSLNFSDYSFVNLQSISGNKTVLIDFLYSLKGKYADTLIWDKQQSQPAMAKNVLNSQFEYIHVFSQKANRAIGAKQFRGTIANVVSLSKQNNNDEDHHATFPIEFAAFFVTNFSNTSVLDLFGGSGSTLIACEQKNRTCYMLELDPHYCDVIRKRYAKFIGKEDEWLEVTPLVTGK